MNLDDAVVLETFPSRIEAELAAGLLESEGVPVLVVADDDPVNLEIDLLARYVARILETR